ncbi:MAG: hypothetical protein JWO50_209 [Candidatus Kaiserbacteria bacterium]|nr:hypothetical protein [Candidatus Kaiserbacteria bacterium]
MTDSVAHTHPLANRMGEVHSYLGFFVMAVTTAVLFGILSGLAPISLRFMIGSEVMPWGVLAWPVAGLIYTYQTYVAYTRPRTAWYAWLDFLGSIAVVVVLVGAILSWFPVSSNVMLGFGFPLAPMNVNTVLVIAAFLWYAIPDVLYYQFRRAQVGLEGVRAGATPAAAALSGSSIDLIINEHSIERMGQVIGEVVAEKLKRPT